MQSSSIVNLAFQYLSPYCTNLVNLANNLTFLNTLLQKVADQGHQLDHALEVSKACKLAYAYCIRKSPNITMTHIILAGFCHDLDDSKFFSTNDYSNARTFITQCFNQKYTDLVIQLISLVSCSQNGNTIDPNLTDDYYIVRHVDRYFALGALGIYRCYEYTKNNHSPIYTPLTKRFTDTISLREYCNERFCHYKEMRSTGASSASMIDHFYDKLLNINVATNNVMIDLEMTNRIILMQDFILDFGADPKFNEYEPDIDLQYKSMIDFIQNFEVKHQIKIL